MASNAKVKERKRRADERKLDRMSRIFLGLDKILSTGEFPKHYVGGGQPFTRGKKPKIKS